MVFSGTIIVSGKLRLEDEMTKLHSTLEKIKNFDCDPGVFKVFLMCCDHMTGFDAWVSFRSPIGRRNLTESVTSHAATPEEAVKKLHESLLKHYSKCPHCGEYPHKDAS